MCRCRGIRCWACSSPAALGRSYGTVVISTLKLSRRTPLDGSAVILYISGAVTPGVVSESFGTVAAAMFPLAVVRTWSPRAGPARRSFTRPCMAKKLKPVCAAARIWPSTLKLKLPSLPIGIDGRYRHHRARDLFGRSLEIRVGEIAVAADAGGIEGCVERIDRAAVRRKDDLRALKLR